MKALLIIGICFCGIRFSWSLLCLFLAKSERVDGETLSAAKAWSLGLIPAAFYIVVFSIALTLIQ